MRAATGRIAMSCLALTGLVLAAGCGGGDSNDMSEASSPSATAPATSAGSTASTTTKPLTEQQLTAAGLQVADLPAGYKADTGSIVRMLRTTLATTSRDAPKPRTRATRSTP